MSDDNSDSDQYQAELNEAVEDGGGCTEMWEALTKERDESTSNRRGILAASGTAALSLVSLGFLPATGAANTVSANDEEVQTEVEKLTGTQRNKAVAEAFADDGVRELMKLVRKNKNKIDRKEAIVTESNYDEQSYLTVVFPVETDRPGRRAGQESSPEFQDAQITWSSLDDTPPNYTITTYESTGDDSSKATITNYLFEDGEITSSSRDITTAEYRELVEEISSQAAAESEVSTQAVFLGPCGVCLPDFNCIYRLARRYSVELVACGACYVKKRPTICLTCLASLIEEGLNRFCDPCPGRFC